MSAAVAGPWGKLPSGVLWRWWVANGRAVRVEVDLGMSRLVGSVSSVCVCLRNEADSLALQQHGRERVALQQAARAVAKARGK